jgi:hypothetical protein
LLASIDSRAYWRFCRSVVSMLPDVILSSNCTQEEAKAHTTHTALGELQAIG